MTGYMELGDIIKEYAGKEITEKELREIESDDTLRFYIKIGFLNRNANGRCFFVTPDLNMGRELISHAFSVFKLFSQDVLNDDYVAAYKDLVENMKNQLTHNYDMHLRIYFTLLKKILGTDFDFSMIDDLYVFAEDARDKSYFAYFIDFYQNLWKDDLYAAMHALERFKDEEFKAKGKNSSSVQLFYKLINKAISFGKKSEKALESPNYYYDFKRAVADKDYDSALYHMDLNLQNCPRNLKDNSRKIKGILEAIRDAKKGVLLSEKELDYSSMNSPFDILNAALASNDYLVAYRNIGKCTYKNSSETLGVIRELLHSLIDIDKKNKKRAVAASKNGSDQNTLKEEMETIDTSSLQREDEKNNDKDLMSEVSATKIKELVLDERLSDVVDLLRERAAVRELSRFEYFVLQLAYAFFNVRKYGTDNISHYYVHNETDFFGRFYEAMKCHDFREAKRCIDNILELDRRNIKPIDNYDEIELYSIILDKILQLIEVEKHKEEYLVRIKEINGEVKKVIFDKSSYGSALLDSDDINKLEELLNEKLEILQAIDGKCTVEENMLNIIEMIHLCENHMIDATYFEMIDSQDKDDVNKLKVSLEYGDYVSAYELLNKRYWKVFASEFRSIDIRLYKALLTYMMNLFKHDVSLVVLDENKEDKLDIVDKLREVVRLYKNKKDALAALNYFLDHDFSLVNSQLQIDIAANLALLSSFQKSKALEIYEKFRTANNNADLKTARLELDEYKQYISGTSLDRDVTHHLRRMEIKEKDMATDDYLLKQELYQKAKDCLLARDYDEALTTINKYIELDNDINYKGYQLRAMIYEKKNMRDLAIQDYLKALDISKEPTVLYRLARLYQNDGEFEKALNYMLDYESIRPGFAPEASRVISVLYGALGDKTKSNEYLKKYNRVKKLRYKRRK